jgi:phosphatidylglycerophosphatase A
MQNNKRPSLKKPEILFLSFFGAGFIPKAPGTFASLVTLPFLFLLGAINPPIVFFIPPLIILTIISSFVAEIVQQQYQIKDPKWIVIDEVIGISLSWLFILKHDLIHLFVIFLLFRFFDIFKIEPARYIDKNIKHGAGVIFDDIISGFYAGITYRVISHFDLLP